MISCDSWFHSLSNIVYRPCIVLRVLVYWYLRVSYQLLYTKCPRHKLWGWGLKIWLTTPSGEYLLVPENRRPDEFYIATHFQLLKWHQDHPHPWKGYYRAERSHLYILHQSHCLFVMEGCSTLEHDAWPQRKNPVT